jgi:hypothetical protein
VTVNDSVCVCDEQVTKVGKGILGSYEMLCFVAIV